MNTSSDNWEDDSHVYSAEPGVLKVGSLPSVKES